MLASRHKNPKTFGAGVERNQSPRRPGDRDLYSTACDPPATMFSIPSSLYSLVTATNLKATQQTHVTCLPRSPTLILLIIHVTDLEIHEVQQPNW
jgi:hypothetical protein